MVSAEGIGRSRMRVTIHASTIYTHYKYDDGRELICFGKRYRKVADKELLKDLRNAMNNQSPLSVECGHEPGIFMFVDPHKGTMLYSDFCVPTALYYAVEKNKLCCGRTDKTVAGMIGKSDKLDLIGVYQRLVFGYTIGPRTRFEGVSVLEPGSMVIFKENRFEKVVFPYIKLTSKVNLDDIWEAIKEEIANIEDENSIGLMLSAGYDSRLILAACNEMGITIDATCTYGLLGTLELKVSYELARETSVRRVLHVDAGAEMFGSADELRSLFHKSGILYQPWWRLCGEYLRTRKSISLCGIQAEIFNGQFLQGVLGGSRILNYKIAKNGYEKYINDAQTFTKFCFMSALEKKTKYFRSEIREYCQDLRQATEKDLLSLAESYKNATGNWSDSIVRFYT